MKKAFLPLLFAALTLFADAQVKMPAPSPVQTIIQNFGMGKIELTYSRPSMKGRKIFGDLVPFQKLWRTGANAATRIRFSDPVEIGGKKIDSGTYVIYTIPSENAWEIILNKGINNWGIDGYQESEDVLHTSVTSNKLSEKVENFTMQFENIKAESCDLVMEWDRTKVSIPIKTDIKSKLKAQIDAAMLTDKKPYWEAAQFYKDFEHNNAKALENATKATEANPKAFWIWLYKARLQEEMGDREGALASAKTSLELAREAKNDDYIKMNDELIKKLNRK